MLSIADYDRAEADGIKRANYPAIRSFRPAAFSMANFPARVTDESELIRYADIMAELYDQVQFYERDLYSEEEAALIQSVSRKVEALTLDLWGRSIQPYLCLFPPIPMLRAIRALSGSEPVSIFEIGPGAGYLGAYLIEGMIASSGSAARYHSTDNTQALYLWQDRFFGRLAGAAHANYATADEPPAAISEPVASVPWWHFAQLYKRPIKADIVICDAAMGEMDVFAVNYIIRLAAEMLKDSRVGAFLFQNIGEQRVTQMAYVEQRFAKSGFRKQQVEGITIHSLKSIALPREFSPLGGRRGMRPAKSFLPIERSKIMDSYAYFDFIKLLA